MTWHFKARPPLSPAAHQASAARSHRASPSEGAAVIITGRDQARGREVVEAVEAAGGKCAVHRR